MPTFNIEYREIERREIRVTADSITDAIKFVEDGGFYFDDDAMHNELYPTVRSYESSTGIDVDGREVIVAEEEGARK